MGSNPTLSAILLGIARGAITAMARRRLRRPQRASCALDLGELIVRMRPPVRLPVHLIGAAGAIPWLRGDVAQLGEHLVRNEGVVGSNPIISTIILGQAQRNSNL